MERLVLLCHDESTTDPRRAEYHEYQPGLYKL